MHALFFILCLIIRSMFNSFGDDGALRFLRGFGRAFYFLTEYASNATIKIAAQIKYLFRKTSVYFLFFDKNACSVITRFFANVFNLCSNN